MSPTWRWDFQGESWYWSHQIKLTYWRELYSWWIKSKRLIWSHRHMKCHKNRCFYSSKKYVYQYGDAMAVVQHGSEKNPIFHLFLFTQNNPHNYYNCNFKNHFLTKSFYNWRKGDCLFYIVELDYLFSKRIRKIQIPFLATYMVLL